MATWFECKVKYNKIDERSGKEKTVTEPYLLDAVSFTEAEERIYKQMESEITGEFSVTSISRTKIEEIHAFEADGWWYKCKVTFVDADEKSGKEKKSTSEILVNAADLNNACDRLKECLKDIVIPYTVKLIQETPLVDVFPYFEGDDVPDYLKDSKKDKKNKKSEDKDTYIGDNDDDVDAYYEQEKAENEADELADDNQ